MTTFNEADHPRHGDGEWATKELGETDPGFGEPSADEMLDSIIYNQPPTTHDDLPDLGLTEEQWSQTTGFGRRNIDGCDNVDTLANKYRAGALSEAGVMGQVFGTDTPQHHLGHNLFDIPDEFPTEPRPMSDTEADGFTQERYGLDGPYIPGYSEVGFTRDEGFEWYRHNFGTSEAKALADAGFTPGEAAAVYRGLGVHSPADAIAARDRRRERRNKAISAARSLGENSADWARAGFTNPVEAKTWHDGGFTPESAAEWNEEHRAVTGSGAHPESAVEWAKVPGMTANAANSWYLKGYTPREVFNQMRSEAARTGRAWEHGDWPES